MRVSVWIAFELFVCWAKINHPSVNRFSEKEQWSIWIPSRPKITGGSEYNRGKNLITTGGENGLNIK